MTYIWIRHAKFLVSYLDDNMAFIGNVPNYCNRAMPSSCVVFPCWLTIIVYLVTCMIELPPVQRSLRRQSGFHLVFACGLGDCFQSSNAYPVFSLTICVGTFWAEIYVLQVRETIGLSAKQGVIG